MNLTNQLDLGLERLKVNNMNIREKIKFFRRDLAAAKDSIEKLEAALSEIDLEDETSWWMTYLSNDETIVNSSEETSYTKTYTANSDDPSKYCYNFVDS